MAEFVCIIFLCYFFSISSIIMAKKEDKRGIELDKDKLLEVKELFWGFQRPKLQIYLIVWLFFL